jgi:two-component system chemotaxis sensor kinase CheA
MVEFDRSAFISKFQEEAADLLQRLNEGVIALEADPTDRDIIDTMLRDAHTLKGSSRMVGLIEVSDVAHWLEDIMVRVRDRDLAYTPDMSDSFFEALDSIVYLTDNAGVNVGQAIDLDALKSRLALIAASGSNAEKPVAPGPSSSAVASASAEVVARAAAAAAGMERPEFEHASRDDELRPKIQNTIRIRTVQVDNLLNVISEVVIAQIKDEQRIGVLKAAQSSADESWKTWQRIRAMLTTAGGEELLEALGEDASSLDALLADRRRDSSALVKGYAEDVSRSSVIVNDLQEQGMRLRMLPANTIFQSFPLAVRDLAKQFRKDINLVIEGGDTELDKKVLEEINDPLVHIMRNAVDHGIEDPATRCALGKPAEGTIVLSARPEGDRIVIEVSDDGAGIDPDKVRESAVRKGYVTEIEAKVMSDREAQYMIFEAGFSTASIITEISGRGVGMDVVREFVVEKLKGSLDLDSEVGRGTVFKLTIPLTLAIIRALMVRVGGQVYALPTASVDETLRVEPSEVIKVEGRDVIRRQRRTIPLVRLSDILGVLPEPTSPKVPIATIGYSGHRMGFIVDAFVGEQQIVIKPLGSHLHKVNNIAGVTILGAGDVVPILNVPDLMTNARQRSGQRVGIIHREDHEGPRSVLICEDSFTTRELERSIFEAAGYVVETANDGAQGLDQLKGGLRVDAVVTDVQMPNMNGFELTRAIKADPVLAETPVIIVTSLERDEEKAEGVNSGADAYITKSVFNQDTLLDTVERLIR